MRIRSLITTASTGSSLPGSRSTAYPSAIPHRERNGSLRASARLPPGRSISAVAGLLAADHRGHAGGQGRHGQFVRDAGRQHPDRRSLAELLRPHRRPDLGRRPGLGRLGDRIPVGIGWLSGDQLRRYGRQDEADQRRHIPHARPRDRQRLTTAFGGPDGTGTRVRTSSTTRNGTVLGGLITFDSITAVAEDRFNGSTHVRSTAGMAFSGLKINGSELFEPECQCPAHRGAGLRRGSRQRTGHSARSEQQQDEGERPARGDPDGSE